MAGCSPLRWQHALAGALVALALAACAGPGGLPVGATLEPLPAARRLVPDDLDLAARDLAAAALASDQAGVARALARLEALEAEQAAIDGKPTGLVPTAIDLAAASKDDRVAYIATAEALLDRDDLDPGTRARLKETVEDEPLRLAAARRRDALVNSIASVFNVIVEPLGRAAMNGVSAAAGLGKAVLGLAISKHLEDEISTSERQALVQEKRFLAESPDAPEAADVLAQVEEDQGRLAITQRDRSLRTARRAMKAGNMRLALLATDRALHFAPEDAEAIEIRDEAAKRLQSERSERSRSLEVASDTGRDPSPSAALPLAVALLDPRGDVAGQARKILDQDPEGPLADEARFARAIALGESHQETEMWEELSDLSKGEDDLEGPNMARHAGLLLTSPDSNPYGAFLAARWQQRGARMGWLFLGPLAGGARDRNLPRSLEWLIEVPTVVEIVTALPNRVLRYPWLDPDTFGHAPRQYARAYLTRYPDGEYAPALREYVIGEESDSGDYLAAVELVKEGETDPDTIADLREKAALQVFERAKKEKRREARLMLAQRAAQQFPETAAGREAGAYVREEVAKATPQEVRLTRNFLLENPEVAGPTGLGIQPSFLDGSLRNGELHPEGVVLAGAQLIELRFVAESGKESDPPAILRKQISTERLARTVALLEETSIRNELVDPDNDQQPDARRDLFFEAARLGVAASPDIRPNAESAYVFKGLRDRYGLVRSRESILPIDIVLQGSLPSLGLGAFPRIRTAKPTPDAILYK